MIENAELHFEHEDSKGVREIDKVHRFGSILYDKMTNEFIPIKITAFEYNDNSGNKIYSIEAVDIIKKKSAGRLEDDSKENPRSPITDFVAKLIESVDNAKFAHENSSKVVDENGEPIVVYHGSYWNPLEEGEGKAAFSTKYHPNIEQVRNYIVNVIVDGIEYYVRFTIHLQRNNNGFICNVVIHKNLVNNKFYLHEVTQKNLLDEVFLANLAQKPTSSGDLAKVLQNIITTKSEASKVVNENGKPKVVYHQTNRTIYRNVENGKLWDDWDWRKKQEWVERDDWDEYWESLICLTMAESTKYQKM